MDKDFQFKPISRFSYTTIAMKEIFLSKVRKKKDRTYLGELETEKCKKCLRMIIFKMKDKHFVYDVIYFAPPYKIYHSKC